MKTQILTKLDRQRENLELVPYTRLTEAGLPASDDPQSQTKAEQLKKIADEIRSVRQGPFLPLTREPVVRALFIVSGWIGGISTIEFLFLR